MKKQRLLMLFFPILLFSKVNAQTKAPNDEKLDALLLGINPTMMAEKQFDFDFTNATISNSNGFICKNEPDLWYAFIPTQRQHCLKINVDFLPNSLILDLLQPNGNTRCITQQQNESFITINNLEIGKLFFIRFPKNNLNKGKIAILTPPIPQNDEFSNAILMGNNKTISGTTLFSTPSEGFWGNDNDVWYKFVATEVTHIVNLSNVTTLTAPSFFDKPIVQLYTASDFQKKLTFTKDQPDILAFNNLNIGETYYLRVFFENNNLPFYFDISLSALEENVFNPSCEKAIQVPVNKGLEAQVTAEALAMIPSTEHSANKENFVWFKFVATGTAHFFKFLKIDANEEYGIDKLKIYEGSCNNLVEIQYNNSSDNKIKTEIGKTYYIAVKCNWATWAEKKFRIAVLTAPQPPTNDECNDAIELNVGNSLPAIKTKGNLVGAFSSTTSSSIDVWYKFKAKSKSHRLYFKNKYPNTSFSLALHKDNCSFWNGSYINSSDTLSAMNNLEESVEYYLRISASSNFLGEKTDFEIAVFDTQVANDECSNAIKLVVNKENQPIVWTDVNTKFATYTPANEPSPCSIPSNARDIWYQFTALSEEMILKVQGNILVYVIYDAEIGNCSNLKFFDCSTSQGSSNWDEVIKSFVDGRKYYLRLINVTDDAKIALIQKTSQSTKPVNDNFATATPITINQNDYCTLTQTGTLFNATKEAIQGLPDIFSGNVIDVWYKFTATTKRHFIKIEDLSFPTVSYYTQIYSYKNNTLSFIKYIDYNFEKEYEFTAGETYYLRIWTSKSSTIAPNHLFEVCISSPTAKANDESCNAEEIQMLSFGAAKPLKRYTSDQIFKGQTAQGCGNNFETNKDFWFKFKATENEGMLILDNMRDESNQPVEDELIVGLYEGNCNNLNPVICPEVLRKNKLHLPNLQIGKEYFIRILKYNDSDNNTFGLFVEQIPKLNKATNDDCANSIHLEVNVDFVANNILNTHNYLSTASNSTNTCNNSADKLDVWFDFTAIQEKHFLIIDQLSSIIPTEYRYSLTEFKIDVYEGSCGSLTSKYCNMSENKIEMADLKIGQKYLIRIYCDNLTFYANWQFFNITILSPTVNSPDNYCWGNITNIKMNNTAPFTKLASSTIHKKTWDKFYTACYKLKPTSAFIIFEFEDKAVADLVDVELRNGNFTKLNNFPSYQKVFKVDTNNVYDISFKSTRLTKFETIIKPFTTPIEGSACSSAKNIPLNTSLTVNNYLIETLNSSANYTSRFYEFTAIDNSHYIFVKTVEGYKNITLNADCDKISQDDEDNLGQNLFRIDHLKPGQKVTFGLHYLKGTYQIAALTIPKWASNDNCSGAINLEISNANCNKLKTFVHKLASSDNIQVNELCTDKNLRRQTLWYKFKAISTNANLTIANIKRFNTIDDKGSVALFKSTDCQSFTAINCEEKDFKANNNLNFSYSNLQVNTEYFIRISLLNTLPLDSALYDICLSNPIIASNIDCNNAITIQSNKGTIITNRYKGSFDQTIQKATNFQCGAWNRELWLKFIAASNRQVIVIKGDSTRTAFGGVFGGSNCNNLSQIVCVNQDTVASMSNLTAGGLYYIRLFTNYNSNYPNIECYLMHDVSPQNERCSNARQLPSIEDNLPNRYIASQATWADEGRYFNCDFTQLNDVWFYFKATSTKQKIHFRSQAYEKDKTQLFKLAVTSGSCNSPTELVCVKNPADTNNTGLLLSNLKVGNYYNICVRNLEKFGINRDTFTIACLPSNHQEANDKCQNALELPVNNDKNFTKFLNYNSAFLPTKSSFADENRGEAWFKFIAKAKTQKIIIKNLSADNGYFFKAETQTQASNCTEPLVLINETNSEKTLENLIAGKTYFVKVSLYKTLVDKTLKFENNIAGSFNIGVISLPDRPENDLTSNAKLIILSKDSSYIGSTSFASSESDPKLSASVCTTTKDVWYRFKSTNNKQPIIIKFNNVSLSSGYNLNPEYQLLELKTFSPTYQTLENIGCISVYENKNWAIKPETDYYIRVYNKDLDNSTIKFELSAFYANEANEMLNENTLSLTPKEEKCLAFDTRECNFSKINGFPMESCGFNKIPNDAWILYAVSDTTLYFNLKKYPQGAVPSILAYQKRGKIFKPMSHLCFFDSLTNLNIKDTIAFRVWSKNNIEGEYEICLKIDKNIVSTKDNQTIAKISLFPNPTSEQLTIRSAILNLEKPLVKIFNLQGQTVFSLSMESNSNSERNIDVSSLPQGAYFLQLSADNQRESAVFIKNN